MKLDPMSMIFVLILIGLVLWKAAGHSTRIELNTASKVAASTPVSAPVSTTASTPASVPAPVSAPVAPTGHGPHGMTWGVVHDPEPRSGYTHVGCYGEPQVSTDPGSRCEPYNGDTLCTQARPILCIHKEETIPPPNPPLQGDYTNWSGGEAMLTPSVAGTELSSLEAANSICQKNFGEGWKMAEFHDGGGWGFSARGELPSRERFWVWINDQHANCWNSAGDLQADEF